MAFSPFSMPHKGQSFDMTEEKTTAEKKIIFCVLILMIITTKFVNKIQNSTKRKLHQFVLSSQNRTELCSACNQVWCSDNRGSNNRGTCTDNQGCTVSIDFQIFKRDGHAVSCFPSKTAFLSGLRKLHCTR